MEPRIVQSQDGVTLVGGGPVSPLGLRLALDRAPYLVAVDRGADRALRLGQTPRAVIGDLDSVSGRARAQLSGRLFPIAEQETTDFDKALRSVAAPFLIGLGFSGGRVDHGLAVFNGLVQRPDQRCVILGGQDVTFLAPRDLRLRLPVGMRLSLFPMGPVQGTSVGLRWPIDGLRLAPDGRIGTSNQVAAPEVRLVFDAARMLVIVPVRALDAVLAGLCGRSDVPGG